MRLTIRHKTSYTFEEPASYGLQQLRKTPKTAPGQTMISWTATVLGGRQELSFTDHHNNIVDLISFDQDVPAITVISEGIVEMSETHGVVGPHRGPSPIWLYERSTPRTTIGAGCQAVLQEVTGDTDLQKLHCLKDAVKDRIAYEIGASQPDWTAEDALSAGAGVCQDHAHVFLACARDMGHPARYVSGYLMLDDRTAQDAMHAWAEVFVTGLGWVGFDVSNGISPDQRYVRVATGLDYAEAAPVTGMRIGGSGEHLAVEIDVTQQ